MSQGQPFLLYRDGKGRQQLLELDRDRVSIGRRVGCDLALPWDDEVSRVHAELQRMGREWVACDEGLSYNGTFINGERVRGRRRLAAGDVVRVGGTLITVCAPDSNSTAPPTRAAGRPPAAFSITPAQRRLLTALCRPLRESRHSAPASNRQIADELVIAVDTVKGTLSALFELFGLSGLPQNAKRATLAVRALDLLGDQR